MNDKSECQCYFTVDKVGQFGGPRKLRMVGNMIHGWLGGWYRRRDKLKRPRQGEGKLPIISYKNMDRDSNVNTNTPTNNTI